LPFVISVTISTWVSDPTARNEALDWAAKVPNSRFGTIEVRPVMEFDA
jgi:hypothetical protein